MPKKSLAKNSAFNVLYKGFTALFPLLTTTYISRTLLPEYVGLVSYAHVIVVYFSTMASLGIPNYGIKEISGCGDNLNNRSQTFMELFSINFISTTIWISIYYLLVNHLPYFYDKKPIMNTMGLLLVLNIFNVDWFYQGIEEYKIISIRGMVVKTLSFLAMLLFVKKTEDYLIYALILCFATAGNYIYNIAHIHKFIQFGKYKLQIKHHLGAVVILLAASIVSEIYLALDTLMLEHYYGSASVAYYTNATKVVRMVYTLVTAMIAPLYPRIAYYIQNGERKESDALINKAYKIVLLLGIPAIAGLSVLADNIVRFLFGNGYSRSIGVLRIASVLVLVFSVSYLLGHIILMASGREKFIFRATAISAAINAVLNFVLIPLLKERGAIIASVMTELVVMSLLIYHGKDAYSIKHSKKFYCSIVISSVIMVVSLVFIKQMMSTYTDFITICTCIFAGVFVYATSLLITKNELVQEYLGKMKTL